MRFIEHVDHLVDLWDVQVGPPIADRHDRVRGRHRGVAPENHQKSWVEQIRPAHARSRSSASAVSPTPTRWSRSIRSGQLDIIGAARPSIADPFLPAKIEAGRLDEIRECIGCNICLSRFKHGAARLVCTQNADGR